MVCMLFYRQAEANSGPVMLTFKQFLNSQSDDIEDMEAVRKYQEYKLEFRKTQIADFFTSHKDEEWYVCLPICFDHFRETFFFVSECIISRFTSCVVYNLTLFFIRILMSTIFAFINVVVVAQFGFANCKILQRVFMSVHEGKIPK